MEATKHISEQICDVLRYASQATNKRKIYTSKDPGMDLVVDIVRAARLFLLPW